MTKSRRILVCAGGIIGLLAMWMAFGPGDYSQQADAQEAAGQKDMQANLDQAATSVVEAAQQGVREAQSEEQVLERTDLSIEALRILGLLGAKDTEAQSEKLLDHVLTEASPAAAEVIVRMRLARKMQRWSKLSQAERKTAIERFVSDVQSQGLTPGHADTVLRMTDNLEMGGQRELASQLVNGLLPAFRSSTEPSVQRRTPVVEGIAHRLDLVGKPFELEGTLLDGEQFDWNAYRGKVVLVDFFANWCGVCREEVPIVMQAYRAYKDRGFEVVGVSLDKQAQLAEAYRKETGFQFPTLFSTDPQNMEWKSPMAIKYGVTSLPRAILIDQDGNVVETVARGQRLFQNLHKLLGPANGLGGLGENGQEAGGELDGESGVVPASFNEPSAEQSESEAQAEK